MKASDIPPLPDHEIVAFALGRGGDDLAEAIEQALAAGDDMHALALGRFAAENRPAWTPALTTAMAKLIHVMDRHKIWRPNGPPAACDLCGVALRDHGTACNHAPKETK